MERTSAGRYACRILYSDVARWQVGYEIDCVDNLLRWIIDHHIDHIGSIVLGRTHSHQYFAELKPSTVDYARTQHAQHGSGL